MAGDIYEKYSAQTEILPPTGFPAWWGSHRKQVIFLTIIFLVSTISFAAGYLINRKNHRIPIIIQKGCPTSTIDLNS